MFFYMTSYLFLVSVIKSLCSLMLVMMPQGLQTTSIQLKHHSSAEGNIKHIITFCRRVREAWRQYLPISTNRAQKESGSW